MNDHLRDAEHLREAEEAAIEREFNPDSAALVDYLGGELSPQKAAEVEERLANDPEFREMAEPLMLAWNTLPKAPPVTAEQVADAWHDVRKRAGLPALAGVHEMSQVSRPRSGIDWRRLQRGMLLAASIVLVVGAPSVWLYRMQSRVATIRTTDVTTTTSVVLPDGSRVQMAEGTTIRYAKTFSPERRVELVGEARFDVLPDSRPFAVVTGTAVVTVTGTSFTVQAYERQPAEIAVHEGSVRVQSRRASTNATLNLTAGQRARVPGLSPPERLP